MLRLIESSRASVRRGTYQERTLRATELLAAKPPPNILSSLEVAGGGRLAMAPEAKLRTVLAISKTLGTALDRGSLRPIFRLSLLMAQNGTEYG